MLLATLPRPAQIERILFVRIFMVVLLSACWLSPVIAVQSDARDQQRRQRTMQRINPAMPQPMKIDPQRVSAAGISVLRGKHITLYTDVRVEGSQNPQASENQNDPRQRWIELFDAAVPLWFEKFDIDRSLAKDYVLNAIVMENQQRFKQARLIPDDLPEFPAGYSRGHEFWMYVQPDDYYTRHLMLHEGTHAIMNWFKGSTGPPWYSEGMAEWMALHSWDEEKLELAAKIRSVADSKGWGRIGRIRKMVAAGKALSLDDVFNIPTSGFRDVKYYAWSWAACEFFSEHPLSARAFARLPDSVDESQIEFNRSFIKAIATHREALDRDWGLFINELDYGYDVRAARLTEATAAESTKPTRSHLATFHISASQSWQTTGIEVRQGDRIGVSVTGEVIVGETTKPWVSQAGGITIDYYSGQPLGKLMACVVPEKLSQQDISSVRAFDTIALGTGTMTSETGPKVHIIASDGILWLRTNESPARLGDNSGHLEVSIFKLK